MSSNQIPTLHYFNGRGRGEASRLILHLAGVQFNDVRHALPFVGEIKERSTYKQLPYFIDGDFEIAQSLAVEYYIANKYNLSGETNADKARVISISQAAIDVCSPIWTNDTEEKKQAYKANTLPRFLNAFERLLTANGGKYFVGSKYTGADANMYYVLENLYDKGFKEFVDLHPALTQFKATFEAIPTIAAYLASRPTNLEF